MHIGFNMRRLRSEAGWSKEDLAVAAGLSSVRVIEISGRARLDSLEAIASAFTAKLGREVTAAELLAEPPGVAGARNQRPARRKRRAG